MNRQYAFFIAYSVAAAIAIIGCCGMRGSKNPDEVFRLWSLGRPPAGVQVLHGEWQQSAGQYSIFLELVGTKGWQRAFIAQNHLAKDTARFIYPSSAPAWFKHAAGLPCWVAGQVNGSIFLVDTISGRMFIYQVQQ